MNTNTFKIFIATILAHTMCMTVVLSHLHAKDAVSLFSHPTAVNKLSTGDITAKALGDLHHHVDKAGVKNIHGDSSTTSGRTRSLNPLAIDEVEESLLSRAQGFLLRLRVIASLCLQSV